MSEKTKKSKGYIYAPSIISVEDELDKLKKVVYIFSCHRRVRGEVSKTLRDKLLLLLSLYIKYGVNSETKIKAADILGIGKAALNSMNLELRREGYLIKDKINDRTNHLHKDLEVLKTYVEDSSETGIQILLTVEV